MTQMKPPLSSSSPSPVSHLQQRSKARLSPYIFTFFGFIVFVVVLYGEDLSCILEYQLVGGDNQPQFISTSPIKKKESLPPFGIRRAEESCDLFSGQWVLDNKTRPLYEEYECPYIQPQLTCQEHGRPDKDYQYWRWKPHGCSLPR
ncbi:hypothetical protein LIER_38215 [Lithospermum erythrorhizon]|uniref:Trichome birefringence-like N-terminal domain-containing protein n=1 Tax=Lithospermum erythrorhizon TaxID=34254 RepID=A0AAV3PYH7_LITER